MMYAVTPAPVRSYVKVVLSGSARWSSRSSPHVAPVCVVVVVMIWSCSTYATLGTFASAAAAASGSSIAIPRNAAR
jgi:hypothetical protein